MDPKKRRDMQFDSVFMFFLEVKKVVTGMEEEEEEFENPF
jgi:hypothetical protein